MDTIIPEIAEAMRTVLNEEALYAGRVSGFVKRKRKLTGASFVQSLVFGYLAQPSASSAELGQAAASIGIAISRQGLAQRFNPASAACLEMVLSASLRQVIHAKRVDLELLKRFRAVRIVDSSSIRLPDSLGAIWSGSGGSSSKNTQAAVKICVDIDLVTGCLDGPLLQSGCVHDRQALVRHRPYEAGSLRIGDLAYFSLRDFAAMQQAGAYYLSRLKAGTDVCTLKGDPLLLRDCLPKTVTEVVDWDIYLGAVAQLPCRLLAQRVPDAVAQDRRERLQHEARRKGQAVSQERLDLCGWTLYVTNVPRALLTVAEAFVLGRSRWQIEILFKLWKSDGGIDESRSTHPWQILTEFYAKLIAMLIQHWVFLTELWEHPERSLHQASQVVRKHAFHLASVLQDFDRLCLALQTIQRALASCRMTKCKSKRHTYELWLQFNL